MLIRSKARMGPREGEMGSGERAVRPWRQSQMPIPVERIATVCRSFGGRPSTNKVRSAATSGPAIRAAAGMSMGARAAGFGAAVFG